MGLQGFEPRSAGNPQAKNYSHSPKPDVLSIILQAHYCEGEYSVLKSFLLLSQKS